MGEDRDPGEAVVVVELLDRPPCVLDPGECEAVATDCDRLALASPRTRELPKLEAEVVEGDIRAVGQRGGEVVGEEVEEVTRVSVDRECIGEAAGDYRGVDHRVGVGLGRGLLGQLASGACA